MASGDIRLTRPLLLIGCGKMGGAMLAGWLKSGIAGGGVAVLEAALAAKPAAKRKPAAKKAAGKA